jgi:hypothetical protein
MSDPSYALQVALAGRLTNLATTAGERIYDDVPPEADRISDTGAAYPYVTIGAGQLVPVDEECWDRSSTYFQIDVWTRTVGFPEAKQIAGAIRSALHEQDLVVPGHEVDRMRIESIDYSRDPNGLTRRARLVLLVDTQPA